MTATATRPAVDTSQPLEPRPVFEQFARCYPPRNGYRRVGLDLGAMEDHHRRCSPWRPAPWHFDRLAAEGEAAK